MKFATKFLSALAVTLVAIPAMAQLGFDTFTPVRTLVLAPPQALVGFAPAATTNGPVDKVDFIGRATIDLFCVTNSFGTTSVTAQVFTSPDSTNWTALANYALITATTGFSITNGYYGGTALFYTNNALLPGTLTTPTGPSSLYTTPYLANLAFTNAAAVTFTGNSWAKIGFSATDTARYLRIVFTGAAGTVTNFTCGATFTATPINPTAD